MLFPEVNVFRRRNEQFGNNAPHSQTTYSNKGHNVLNGTFLLFTLPLSRFQHIQIKFKSWRESATLSTETEKHPYNVATSTDLRIA